ncbi:MAG TPA: response regulator [Gemmatimonadaceae bacterium]|nr:response regulator [Gemmatimonadaceae bacterium]
MYSNTILLVQPRTDLGAQLRTRLEGKGYSVIVAEDTAAAMDIVNASEIGLVVTELYLRVGKSRCLARAIGRSPGLRRTKLLAYTTHGKRADRDWARQIGADGYVITRSGEERFVSVVDHLMAAPSTRRGPEGSFRRRRREGGDGSQVT